jgi:hypothetical protein
MSEGIILLPVPCPRGTDECTGTAQPEEEDNFVYWVCDDPECGFTTGYQMVGSDDVPACSVGVPLEFQPTRPPVPITIGKRPA